MIVSRDLRLTHSLRWRDTRQLLYDLVQFRLSAFWLTGSDACVLRLKRCGV